MNVSEPATLVDSVTHSEGVVIHFAASQPASQDGVVPQQALIEVRSSDITKRAVRSSSGVENIWINPMWWCKVLKLSLLFLFLFFRNRVFQLEDSLRH